MEVVLFRKEKLFERIKREATICEIAFWWITRFLIICCAVKNESAHMIFYLTVFLLTFFVDFLHILMPEINIGARLQTHICSFSLLSTVLGLGFGVIENHPDYDIVLQLAGGIFAGALGYYIITALKKPETKKEYTFVTFFTLCFSGTLTFFRKLTEFFCDFYFGTNLCHVEFVEDSHWLYEVFGFAMSPREQRPLLDTDEDFIFSIVGGVLITLTVYFKFRVKNPQIFKTEKEKTDSPFKNFLPACKRKIALEISKVNEQTSIFDRLFWWVVRFAMFYAFIVWENRPEATLLLANLVGTFAITLIHLVFPEKSVLCKVSYKTQTLITIIVFLGSYCGNYCFIYGIYSRYDLFLHFISGFLCVFSGYYIALTLMKPETKRDRFIIALFSFCFSCFIMPAWEVSEFVGDFIWGTSNQGFYWGPSDESFFFKIFGRGAGNTQLYYLFDTVYDVLLAMATTVISFFVLIFMPVKKNSLKPTEEKQKVTC